MLPLTTGTYRRILYIAKKRRDRTRFCAKFTLRIYDTTGTQIHKDSFLKRARAHIIFGSDYYLTGHLKGEIYCKNDFMDTVSIDAEAAHRVRASVAHFFRSTSGN